MSSAVRLVRSAQRGWAINRRGRRIELASWDVLVGGKRAGSVHQFLAEGGVKPWIAEGPGLYEKVGTSRQRAIQAVLAALPYGGQQ